MVKDSSSLKTDWEVFHFYTVSNLCQLPCAVVFLTYLTVRAFERAVHLLYIVRRSIFCSSTCTLQHSCRHNIGERSFEGLTRPFFCHVLTEHCCLIRFTTVLHVISLVAVALLRPWRWSTSGFTDSQTRLAYHGLRSSCAPDKFRAISKH